MSGRNNKLNLMLAASLTMALAQPVFADRDRGQRAPRHGGYRGSGADVDIESLKAKLLGGWNDSVLQVRCKVEIEDAWPGQRFDLWLRVTERGRELSDRRGRPVRVRVPLNRPTDIDDDEFEFDERLELPLPHAMPWNAKRLRIQAKVVGRNSGRVFDRDDATIKVETSRTPRMAIAPNGCDRCRGGALHSGTECRRGGEVRRAARSQRRQTVQQRQTTKQRTIKKTTKKRNVRHSTRTVRRTSRKPTVRAGIGVTVRR